MGDGKSLGETTAFNEGLPKWLADLKYIVSSAVKASVLQLYNALDGSSPTTLTVFLALLVPMMSINVF
jgi:hypothetical protein